jgi:hypothetical protein
VRFLIHRGANHQQKEKKKDTSDDGYLSLVTSQPLPNRVAVPKSKSRK